jgi:hypothetical protein
MTNFGVKVYRSNTADTYLSGVRSRRRRRKKKC